MVVWVRKIGGVKVRCNSFPSICYFALGGRGRVGGYFVFVMSEAGHGGALSCYVYARG
jgi:hypothetical protein